LKQKAPIESIASDDHRLQPTHEDAPRSDRDLWRAFKSGDRGAFVSIYNLYFDKLYGYGHQFTADTDLIKDCIQDLFIDLDRTRARLSDTHSIQFYLFKSLKRSIIRKIKVGQRDNQRNAEAELGKEFHVELSAEQKMISQRISEEQKERLNHALQELTGRQREIIYYFYYESFSMEQIRELMDFQSVKAAQNLLYRAIKVLRSLLFQLLWITIYML
jgi:RNA polymerase sigma-70 factor (ECF subfamily)